jgi:hypothetical protein
MSLFSNFTIEEDLVEIFKERGIGLPSYNILEDESAITFEEKDSINKDLVPIKEYKITINKESATNHYSQWLPIFSEHYMKHLSLSEDYCKTLLDGCLLQGIERKFKENLLRDVIQKQEDYRREVHGN